MNKIVIIGSPGSGKTWFSQEVGEKCNIPVTELDALWEACRNTEEFDQTLDAILARPQWILDGNNLRTIDKRLDACDSILFLDFGALSCFLGGLEKRLKGNRHRSLKWFLAYQKENRVLFETLMGKYQHKKIVILKNNRSVRKFLKSL